MREGPRCSCVVERVSGGRSGRQEASSWGSRGQLEHTFMKHNELSGTWVHTHYFI